MEQQLHFESQFFSDNFADVYFVINNGEESVNVPAHKVMLAAGSPFLQKYLSENVDVTRIELTNTSVPALKEFLVTFYSQNPERFFTIENVDKVLTLAKEFGAVRCTKLVEKFLMKISNLPIGQICFGYAVAMQFNLGELKFSCKKRINDKLSEVVTSQTFYNCNQAVLFDLLKNVTVNQLDEKKLVWDACMIWAEKQCTNGGMDSANMKMWRDALGECFDSIKTFVSKDGELKKYVMEHYAELFSNDDGEKTLSTTHDVNGAEEDDTLTASMVVCEDSNQNKIIPIEIVRFQETMLATQLCEASEPIQIVFQSTKRLVLNGFAFGTAIGIPHGKITIGMRDDGNDVVLIQQEISRTTKRREPRNHVSIDDVILEPNKEYIIKVELTKDIVYYRSRLVSNVHSGNGFTVTFKKEFGRDIVSHFFFNDCF